MAEMEARSHRFYLRISRSLFFTLILFSLVAGAFLPSILLRLTLAALALLFVLGFEHKMRLCVEHLVQKKCAQLVKEPLNNKEFQILQLQIEKKQEEMRQAYLEFEDLRQEYHRLEEEYRLFKKEKADENSRREKVVGEYKTTIFEQRAVIEKKQVYITELENRVRDLMYEMRCLLQLEEPVSTALPPIDMLNREEVHDYYMGSRLPTFDLDMELSRIVDLAEAFTGANHLGSRFLKSASSLSIDLRRLFDLLKDETSGILFFYSVSQKRMLFANNYVKILLGFSPDKFVNDFPSLVIAGLRILNEAFTKLQGSKRLSLVLATKSGEEKKVDCEIKLIQKGPFAGNIIGMIIE